MYCKNSPCNLYRFDIALALDPCSEYHKFHLSWHYLNPLISLEVQYVSFHFVKWLLFLCARYFYIHITGWNEFTTCKQNSPDMLVMDSIGPLTCFALGFIHLTISCHDQTRTSHIKLIRWAQASIQYCTNVASYNTMAVSSNSTPYCDMYSNARSHDSDVSDKIQNYISLFIDLVLN